MQPRSVNMETTLDRFGRVLIPKRLRNDLGLEPGAILEIEATPEGFVLKPLHEEPLIMEKEGVMVFKGVPTGDIVEAAKAHRQERSQKIIHRALK
jgi:AbrB family looped-hinge helix DNA binding protein